MKYLLAAFTCLFGLVASPALAADCSAFSGEGGKGQNVSQQQPIDQFLLIKNPAAVGCIVEELKKLRRRVVAPKLDPGDEAQLVRLTGAARTVLVNGGLSAITDFRNRDDADVIAVLAFGARGDGQSVRINATRVLSDVIDNNSICVVLDHLYDPEIDKTEFGRSGRVNLLGVTSVNAPWAYRENYENIARLVVDMRGRLRGEDDAATSLRVLENIESRLRYQDTLKNSYKNLPLPRDLQECRAYRPQWAGDKLRY